MARISIIILFWIYCGEILGSSVYFPSKLNPNFEKKVGSCIQKSLPPFQFVEKDMDPSAVRRTFQAIQDRSNEEGRSRARSVICLRNLELTSIEKEDLRLALGSFFRQEKELFFLYTRFLDNSIGLNRSRNPGYLKSRYDLLMILQTKTEDWILGYPQESTEKLESEFASIYLSILRTHYDFLVEIGENGRSHYFKSREGRK